jgi:hypothetical protein
MLTPNDSLLLFYAGHGGTRTHWFENQLVKTGYLIPVDASDKAVTWIALDSWLRAVSLLPPRHILVVIDACYSGIALGPIIKWRDCGVSLDAPLATLGARRSRRVITSALDDEVVLDSGPIHGHSLFTGCLLEGLTHGLRAGRRTVTGSELALYVQHRVRTFPNSRQTPDFGTFDFDDRGEMVISLARERSGDCEDTERSSPPDIDAADTLTSHPAVVSTLELEELSPSSAPCTLPPINAGCASAKEVPRGIERRRQILAAIGLLAGIGAVAIIAADGRIGGDGPSLSMQLGNTPSTSLANSIDATKLVSGPTTATVPIIGVQHDSESGPASAAADRAVPPAAGPPTPTADPRTPAKRANVATATRPLETSAKAGGIGTTTGRSDDRKIVAGDRADVVGVDDIDAILAEIRQALTSADYATAKNAAQRAIRRGAGGPAYASLAIAYCGLHDLGNAKAQLFHLPEPELARVTKECRPLGVELE